MLSVKGFKHIFSELEKIDLQKTVFTHTEAVFFFLS